MEDQTKVTLQQMLDLIETQREEINTLRTLVTAQAAQIDSYKQLVAQLDHSGN